MLMVGLIILSSGCTPASKEIVIKENVTAPETTVNEIIPPPDNPTINYCTDFCHFVKGGDHATYDYNKSSERFSCQCFDYEKSLIVKKEITPRDLELYRKRLSFWQKMPITYQIINPQDCGDYETKKIELAFKRIQDATQGVVQFQPVQQDADINLTCKFIKDCYYKKIDIRKEEGVIYKYEGICAHEAGVTTITSYQGFTLKKATIDLIGLAGFAETSGSGASGFYIGSCGHPTVEIHEMLHALGFGHVPDPQSIMYYQAELVPYTIQKEGACIGSDKQIDQKIVDDLLFTYG